MATWFFLVSIWLMLDISKYLEISTNIDILGRQASASVCRAVCSESIKAQGKLGAICIILHSPGYCIITVYCRFCQSKILNYFPGCNCFTPCNPNLCPLNLVGPVHPVHPTQPLPIMKTCFQCNGCRRPKKWSQSKLVKSVLAYKSVCEMRSLWKSLNRWETKQFGNLEHFSPIHQLVESGSIRGGAFVFITYQHHRHCTKFIHLI